MSYEVHDSNGNRLAGPFAVLDTALDAARQLTTPTPPKKPLTPMAQRFGTRDTDPFGLAPPTPRMPVHARVVEVDRGRKMTRAFYEDGRCYWGKACKSCAHFDAYTPVLCGVCGGLRRVPDRS